MSISFSRASFGYTRVLRPPCADLFVKHELFTNSVLLIRRLSALGGSLACCREVPKKPSYRPRWGKASTDYCGGTLLLYALRSNWRDMKGFGDPECLSRLGWPRKQLAAAAPPWIGESSLAAGGVKPRYGGQRFRENMQQARVGL